MDGINSEAHARREHNYLTVRTQVAKKYRGTTLSKYRLSGGHSCGPDLELGTYGIQNRNANR